MLRKWIAFLLLVLMALTVTVCAAEDAPVLIDRINAPEIQADFAFGEDAELLEIIFPQILNCDAIFIRCGWG